MSKIIDISIPLSKETIIYPGDPIPEYTFINKLDNGEIANVGQMKHGLHHGTHVDVPYHFYNDGKKLDEMPLETFVGPALVIDATDEETCISAETLAGKPVDQYRIVLFKTKNSTEYYKLGRFYPGFIYIDKSACDALVAAGVKLVGLDYITVDPHGSPDFPAHNTLLSNEVCIIECLDLSMVGEGVYQLYCLPLKLTGTDGANARAVLIVNE